MSFKSRLIDCSWIVVSFPHMLLQFLIRKQVVLVRKHFLVPRAQITNFLVVYRSNMAMQIRPAQTSNIAVVIGTIIPQQQDSILSDIIALISDPNILVRACNIFIREILIPFRRIVGEDNIWCWCLYSQLAPHSSAGREGEYTRQ
jgi:hypothetical protein